MIREKPFLFVPAEDAWRVAVPSLTWQAREPNWPQADPAARELPIDDFLIVRPDTPDHTMKAALAADGTCC